VGLRQFSANDKKLTRTQLRLPRTHSENVFTKSRSCNQTVTLDLRSKYSQQRSLKMQWKTAIIIVKKLFNLNSSVMDDNHETYKTANVN
jgi:hypothetical protein